MTEFNIIVVGVIILTLLSILSIMLLKHSSKEYPIEEEVTTPKFEARKITDLSKGTIGLDPIEKPKRKYKKKKKKKPSTEETEKKPAGRPKKSE
jgi:hypothetical protein